MMTDFAVIPGTGLILEVDDGTDTDTFITVGRITQLALGDGQTSFTDVSDFSTVKNKVFVPGIKNLGNATFSFIFEKADVGQAELKEIWESHETRAMRVTFPDIIVGDFAAFVNTWNLNGTGYTDNKITGTFTLVHNGDITWTVPS